MQKSVTFFLSSISSIDVVFRLSLLQSFHQKNEVWMDPFLSWALVWLSLGTTESFL